jgi:hypothetical protein
MLKLVHHQEFFHFSPLLAIYLYLTFFSFLNLYSPQVINVFDKKASAITFYIGLRKAIIYEMFPLLRSSVVVDPLVYCT